MFSYVVKRLAIAVSTLHLLIVISFLLMHAAPGGPFTQERAVPPQILANLEAKYGLDQPLWRQLLSYVWGIVAHFDFGPSFIYKDRTVNEIIAQGFPVTLTYGSVSFVIAVLVGVSLGIAAAIRHNTWLDYLAVGVSIGAQVLPNFVMAPLLLLTFTWWLGWLPGGGWEHGQWQYMVMPVIALSTSFMASIARITRASMLEVLTSNHIRTARAKGLPETRVLMRHALANAAVPIITVIGIGIALLIGGVVVTESVYAIPGLGRLTVDAVLARDFPTIQGVILFFSVVYVLINLVIDLSYVFFDPRIRY